METERTPSNHGFEAKVIADSINGKHETRLTTLQLRYPRFIHAEFMTHRMFSRNASSSRAIPVRKMIEQVRKDPAMPVHWGKNQPGMQAREWLEEPFLSGTKTEWLNAANAAAEIAEEMERNGAHKQIVNRILEPFQFIHVVVSATEWANFFELRCHEDAQPEIHMLATMMREAIKASTPIVRYPLGNSNIGSWHLPYVTDGERELYSLSALIKMSAARCARVSYLTHDGSKPDPMRDLELYERLVGSRPIHASPTEHQAYANNYRDFIKNFRGWVQHRDEVEARARVAGTPITPLGEPKVAG